MILTPTTSVSIGEGKGQGERLFLGRSRAGEGTSFALPELKWLFDCGALIQGWKPKVVFITHTHIDHIHFLTHVKHEENPPIVYLPTEALPFVKAHLVAHQEMLDCMSQADSPNSGSDPVELDLRPVKAGEVIPLQKAGKDFEIRTLQMHHRVPCVGYSIFVKSSQLKDEYKKTPGKELGRLRKRGVQIADCQFEPLICFMGDTTARAFSNHPEILTQHKYIVVECSFIDKKDAPNAERHMHMHWNELKPYVEGHPDVMFILTHFSLKYSAARLRKFFQTQDLDNVHPMILQEEVFAQWKNQPRKRKEEGSPFCSCRIVQRVRIQQVSGINESTYSMSANFADLDDENLMELVQQRMWREAREHITADPGSIYRNYDTPGNSKFVIHQLMSLHNTVTDDGEISDDEEDSVPSSLEPLHIESLEEVNQNQCELVQYMLETSHTLGPVVVDLAKEDIGNESPPYEDQIHTSVLTLTTSLGKTPLHSLCERFPHLNMMRTIFASSRDRTNNPNSPSAVAMITAGDSWGSTPLHYLSCLRDCPISSLQCMMDYGKVGKDNAEEIDVTMCVNMDGETPLHWALEACVTMRRVKELLRYSTDALNVRNKEGFLPTDLLLQSLEPMYDSIFVPEVWEWIQSLLKAVVDFDESQEWLPLHKLAASPVEFPRTFHEVALRHRPEDLGRIDSEGMLPLHLACARMTNQGQQRFDIVARYLSEQSKASMPAAVTKRLPLHFALASQQPIQTISILFKAHPTAVSVKDPVTGLWPFLLAASHNDEDIEACYYLLRADPSLIVCPLRC